jgi:hypothetical protein
MGNSSGKTRAQLPSLSVQPYNWETVFYMKFKYLAVRTVLYGKQVEYFRRDRGDDIA